MSRHLVFVAAGGRGKRLWDAFPELKKSGLPKSLGLIVGNRPLLAYQLDILTKLSDYKIVLSFNEQKSIRTFLKYIDEEKIPPYDYLLNLDTLRKGNAAIDILRGSKPNKPWESNFETIIISSGDVYFNPQHLSKLIQTCNSEKCNVQTLCGFSGHMATLKTHFHPAYNRKGELKYIKADKSLPKEIVCHPQLLTEKAFRIYSQMPKGVTKSEFTNLAIQKGEKFKVIEPKRYVNVNFPQDYEKARTLLSS